MRSVKKIMRILAVFVTLIIFHAAQEADFAQQRREIRNPSKRPKDFLTPARTAPYMRTKEYKEKYDYLERYFWWLFEPEEKEKIIDDSKDYVLNVITSDKSFNKIQMIRYLGVKNPDKIIPDLIQLIIEPKVIGLADYADLIIWERIQTGDLKFYGHGWVVSDDLLSIA